MSEALKVPPPGFDDLSVDEQVAYVEALWERIAAREDQVPVPDWHHEVLTVRLADLAANPDAGRSWVEVEADLTRKTLRRR
jgi:putative addiction module component (TIGR02574 family)